MAGKMEKCKACGKLISELALFCPHCGDQPGLRLVGKFFGFVLKVAGLLLLVAFCFDLLDSWLGDNSTRDYIVLALAAGAYLAWRIRGWRAKQSGSGIPRAPVKADARE